MVENTKKYSSYFTDTKNPDINYYITE